MDPFEIDSRIPDGAGPDPGARPHRGLYLGGVRKPFMSQQSFFVRRFFVDLDRLFENPHDERVQ